MGGVAPTGKHAGIVQNDRGRADRRDPALGVMLAQHERTHPRIGAEVLYSGASWEKHTVVRRRGGRMRVDGLIGGRLLEGREGRIGVHRHTAPASYVDAIIEGSDDDLGTGAAQKVDGDDRFNFLKSLREDCENLGHRESEARMSSLADGIFSRKQLVIFGCGYVGSEVARQALGRGVSVTAFTRNHAKAADLRALGCGVVVGDLASDEWHSQIAGGADYVLNCVSSGGGGIEGYRRSYVEGMRSVLAWAKARGGVGTMIYTGSTSVYPQGGGAVVDETASTANAGERAGLLLEAENLLRANEGACKRWFVLRLAGIYGPGRHHLLEQVRSGEVAGRGDYHLNLIYRDDIAAGVWAAMGAPATVASDVCNLADDGAALKSEIVAWLAARLGVPMPRFTGEPAAGRREVTPDRVISNAKAKALLGWRPASADFRAGYEKIVSR